MKQEIRKILNLKILKNKKWIFIEKNVTFFTEVNF